MNSFSAESIDYLGRKISEQGVRLGQRKIEAIQSIKVGQASETVCRVGQLFSEICSNFRGYN